MSETLRFVVMYFYGYQGRDMAAVRAPYAMTDNARDLIGRTVQLGDVTGTIRGIERQVSGPVAQGEPIGIEIDRMRPDPTISVA